MKYEQLVARPETELAAITTFLGIPYSESMVRYHEGKTRDKPGLSAKSAWLPTVQNLGDWRKDMSAEDIGVFEGVAGTLLRALGYSCTDQPPGAAVRSRVSRCLDWWESEGLY